MAVLGLGCDAGDGVCGDNNLSGSRCGYQIHAEGVCPKILNNNSVSSTAQKMRVGRDLWDDRGRRGKGLAD